MTLPSKDSVISDGRWAGFHGIPATGNPWDTDPFEGWWEEGHRTGVTESHNTQTP